MTEEEFKVNSGGACHEWSQLSVKEDRPLARARARHDCSLMPVEIGPRDIHLFHRPHRGGFQVIATWRDKTPVGDAEYLIEDDNRALITMIEVSDNALVSHKW